jgi:N-dimethylarginine dimethylaminohydrolase
MKNDLATFGGDGFLWRETSLLQDFGSLWSAGFCKNEGDRLTIITLAAPGTIFNKIQDPNKHLLIEIPNLTLLQQQFEQLVACYENLGIKVHQLPGSSQYPNWIFQRDLFNATPHGVILARPASMQRKGEEVQQQLALAQIRAPIIMMPTENGLFEGPDMLWINDKTALIAKNKRSNAAFFDQFQRQFPDIRLIDIPLPKGSQHLLGIVNFIAPNHIAVWEGQFPSNKISTIKDLGIQITSFNQHHEIQYKRAMNWVCIGANEVVLPDDAPEMKNKLNSMNVCTHTTPISEYRKCGGGIGCATGILQRMPTSSL